MSIVDCIRKYTINKSEVRCGVRSPGQHVPDSHLYSVFPCVICDHTGKCALISPKYGWHTATCGDDWSPPAQTLSGLTSPT